MHCVDCRFYRMKSAVGEIPSQEWGICDSPEVRKQLWMFGFAILRRTNVPEATLREIGWRVRGDFGCIHFKAREEVSDADIPAGGEADEHV